MNRGMAIVLLLGIVTAAAGAAITVTSVKTGTYTVTTGVGLKTVDVYKLSATTTAGEISGYELYIRGPMFQVWKAEYDEETGQWDIVTGTPTLTGAGALSSTQRAADSHLLHSEGDYLSTTVAPVETNVKLFGYVENPDTTRNYFGLGANSIFVDAEHHHLSFAGQCALKTEKFAPTVDIGQFAVVQGLGVVSVWGAGGATGSVVQEFYPLSTEWVAANGPYQIGPGQEITLQGSHAWNGNLGYWDLDGDGAYDDATGMTPTISYSYLVETLGLAQGSHFISLGYGSPNPDLIDFGELTIVPEPMTLSLVALAGAMILGKRRRGF